jgi:hypothetical protein
VGIIGMLLLVALPLYTGARVRGYVAEARHLTSEWKSVTWTCLVGRSFDETSCDTVAELSWSRPADSSTWQWQTSAIECNVRGIIDPLDVWNRTCTANETDPLTFIAVRVMPQPGLGLPSNYVLVIRSNTGKVQESPADGTTITAP